MTDFSGENTTATNGPTTPTSTPTPTASKPFAPSRPFSRPEDGKPPGAPDSSGPDAPGVTDTAKLKPIGDADTPPPAAADVAMAEPPNRGPEPQAVVKGRIEVADEVVEKVAGLAVMEVEGVADLGGDIARAIESVRERIGIGNKRGDQGIKAKITGRDVALNVTIMVNYGHVVMDVAREVQTNVARQTHRMLGLRVVEVNVTVDDVRMPGEDAADEESDEADGVVTLDS